MQQILLLNGPNLNLLGSREPHIYGTDTLNDVETRVTREAHRHKLTVRTVQSNHEGILIDEIHAAQKECSGIIINAGALTHTSLAIKDALTSVTLPIGEVHISNVHARENIRAHSFISPIAKFVIVGCGVQGYEFAVQRLAEILSNSNPEPSHSIRV